MIESRMRCAVRQEMPAYTTDYLLLVHGHGKKISLCPTRVLGLRDPLPQRLSSDSPRVVPLIGSTYLETITSYDELCRIHLFGAKEVATGGPRAR